MKYTTSDKKSDQTFIPHYARSSLLTEVYLKNLLTKTRLEKIHNTLKSCPKFLVLHLIESYISNNHFVQVQKHH